MAKMRRTGALQVFRSCQRVLAEALLRTKS
jgi:hypothetical protein